MMPDVNWTSQVRRGVLELCVLNLLSRESVYGYEIVRRLRSLPGMVVTEGTVYPILRRLRHEGLITGTLAKSPLGPKRRSLTLTEKGTRQTVAINNSWETVTAAVAEFVPAIPNPRR